MGNKTYAPVLGRGTAIISLNGRNVLVCDTLHVPGLRIPLYSLRAHHCQHGCGFIGAESMGGMYVWFPTFLITVDTANDCLLSYHPLGRFTKLTNCHYVQPRVTPTSLPPSASDTGITTALKPWDKLVVPWCAS